MRNIRKNRKKRIEQDKEHPINKGKLEHASRGITMHDRIKQPEYDTEMRYRALFENANDAIFIAEDGKFVECNPKTCEMFGCTLEQIIGKTPYDHYSPEFQPDGRKSKDKVLEKIQLVMQGQPQFFEWRHLRYDGSTFDAEISLNRLELSGTVFIQAIVRDLTDRKKALEAIRESEEKFRILAEQSPNMIFINKAGRIVYANKQCEEITGYKREELYSPDFDFLTLIAPESLEMIKDNFRRHSKGLEIPPYEYTIINKAGEKIVAINSSKLTEYEGQTAILGVITDITEKKHLQEAYHSLVDNSLQGLAIVQDGRMVFLNKAFTSTTGYSKEDLLAASPEQIQLMVHPEDRELVWSRHRDRIDGKPVSPRYEFRWIRKDGSICWVEIYASRIEYQGRPAIQTAYVEITERKKSQRKLLDYQRQLKSLASELLLAEERERRRIAAGVHDDIGQKLALAKLELQSIQAIVSEPDISASLGHACELIDNGIQDSRSLAFDLSNPVLYEVGFTAAVETLLTEKMMKKSGIKTEFESKTHKLKLGQDMSIVLFQAVRELLMNVVKHAKAHKVKVCIDKFDDRVHVIVEDDGTGFELSKLQSPDRKKGGFGLFNVKERLEYLGGSFDIKSKPRHGTRVTMIVPVESGIMPS
ncbi:MAG: PAS domain S-box protein [Sedimentisphaerales bacterium]|nr:PAS domain S-box protein [Sedimentisphaerales bacterium]